MRSVPRLPRKIPTFSQRKMATLITFVAVGTGIEGNLIATDLIVANDSSTVAISVALVNFDQATITITVGSLDGINLNVADWDAVAAVVNANTQAKALVVATGTSQTAVQFDGGPLQSLSGGSQGLGAGVFYFGLPALVVTAPSNSSSPGRGMPIVTINDEDLCLTAEFSDFERIDPQAFSCGRKPLCFLLDERDWSGIEDAEEVIQSGPPAGAVTLNPSGAISLPDPSLGNVVIFQFRVPLGYDGILLGQYHGYIPAPLAPPTPFVEGSGDIAWRIAIDGRYARDCGQMEVSLGAQRALSPIAGGIQLRSANLVQYIAQFLNATGSLTPGLGSLPASLHGYCWPRR